jgi:acetyl esterase/lipase
MAVTYGPDLHQLLDLHLPDRARYPAPVPVIVYVHSGGWISGTRADVPDAALAQVGRGYAVASVDYQLAGTGATGLPIGAFPGAVWDVKRAIRFLKAYASDWGLDPARVIVMGSSAGGHLAALVGASAGQLEPAVNGPLATVDSSVIAIVDLVGITDLATFETTNHPWAAPLTAAFVGCPAPVGGQPRCPADLLARASVAPYVDGSDPPIFMVYGALDQLVVPATQGGPLAKLWLDAHHGDQGAAIYDVVPDADHNVDAHVDMARLGEFLDRSAGGAALTARRGHPLR